LTSRERALLVAFLAVAAAAGLMIGLGSYFERRAFLDSEFAGLRKRALRSAQGSLADRQPGHASAWSRLKERFFAPGSLPDPLTLASCAQQSLKTAGIRVEESRITESSKSAQWIQYRSEGDIEAWFRFLQILRSQDSRTLLRSLSLAKKEGFSYAITFEVGHAVLP
jgi:hypothetical protein